MEEEERRGKKEFEEQSVKNGILGFDGMQRKMVGFKLNPEILISSTYLKKPFGILFLLFFIFWFLFLWV